MRAGIDPRALQQIIEITIADAETVVATAVLASYRGQLLSVEPGQENSAFAVTHETAVRQWHGGAGGGADTENGQLPAELLCMSGQCIAFCAVESAGQQEYLRTALRPVGKHLPGQRQEIGRASCRERV